MSAEWSFLSKPETYFVALLAVASQIVAHILITQFPRWLAAINGWKSALNLFLWIYASIVLICAIGSVVLDEHDTLLFRISHDGLAYLVLGCMPVLLIMLGGKLVEKLLLSAAVVVASCIAIYTLRSVPAAQTLPGMLFSVVLGSWLLSASTAFGIMCEAIVWLFKTDWKAR